MSDEIEKELCDVVFGRKANATLRTLLGITRTKSFFALTMNPD